MATKWFSCHLCLTHRPLLSIYIESTSDFFNPFPSVCLSKDLLNTPIFFRADFCPPTNAHPTSYPTAPCPPRCPPSSHTLLVFAIKISHLECKKEQNWHLSNLSFEEFAVDKIASERILQDVHLGKGDKGLSLFFFPIQNDSMSVLLIWRVHARKKAQPTYLILFLEDTRQKAYKHAIICASYLIVIENNKTYLLIL